MRTGESIREHRKKIGISQKELGKRLGVSQQHIAQYETGKRIPKPDTIIKIARALNVDFLELADDPNSKFMKARRDSHDISVYGEVKKRTFEESVTELESSKKFFEDQISSMFYSFSNIGTWGQVLEKYYQLLNDKGKIKADNEMKHAVEQVELLTKIPEYQKEE